MFVNYRGSLLGLISWQWRMVVVFLVASGAVAALHQVMGAELPSIPATPLAVVGGAIGIFVSFRTNSGYQRWWEGRQLWGRLVNSSRHWSTQILTYLSARPHEAQVLVRRQIAYVHVLRCLLRQQDPFADADVKQFLTAEELSALRNESNATHALLHLQMQAVVRLAEEKIIDGHRMQSLDETLRQLLDVQGGCERIKKTPFPRGYGFIAERLIVAYSVLLPLGVVQGMEWAVVPMTVLVCLAFTLISEVGRVLEDPFTMFWPALPLGALSKTIEVNLRQRLGETELPALPQPDARGILM